MKLSRLLAGLAVAATTLVATALTLDRLFPPDLSRYQDRSTEVVDANGRLLRAFTTADGKWRLKTAVDDVDPLYLGLLKAYEDRRFDTHWGVDPLAAVRAARQLAERGRIVSGASTLSMQAARLLDPRPRSFTTKALQSARALQLEWRYSKREVLAIYLTLAPMACAPRRWPISARSRASSAPPRQRSWWPSRNRPNGDAPTAPLPRRRRHATVCWSAASSMA